MSGIVLPSSALRPSQSHHEVPVDTVIPVHGVLTIVQVVGELAEIAVVVLDIIDAAGTTRHETTLGLGIRLRCGLGLSDRSGNGSSDQEAGQPSSEDFHVGWAVGKEERMYQKLSAEWTCAEEDRVLNRKGC